MCDIKMWKLHNIKIYNSSTFITKKQEISESTFKINEFISHIICFGIGDRIRPCACEAGTDATELNPQPQEKTF